MVTEKTQAADGDGVTLLKAPEQVDLELTLFCQLAAIFIYHLFYHFGSLSGIRNILAFKSQVRSHSRSQSPSRDIFVTQFQVLLTGRKSNIFMLYSHIPLSRSSLSGFLQHAAPLSLCQSFLTVPIT